MTRHQHPDDGVWIDRASGNPAGSDAVEVARHLEGCSECRRRLAQYEEILESLGAPQPGRAPLHVLPAILARQNAARASSRRHALAPQPFRLLAAALVAVLLFVGGYSSGRHAVTAGGASRAKMVRAPLPAPPHLVLEPATAGLGDLALAPWARDSSHTGGAEPPASRDSL